MLVVRTDRIGDVVLSLPMVTILRSTFPAARITMLLRSYTRELAGGFIGLDETIVSDQNGEPKPFFSFLSELRSLKFDLAVVAHPTLRVAVLLFLAGIPVRVGTGYRWYSFLFNTRVFEHRKTAEKHEAEYNLSLLKAVGCNSSSVPCPVLPISLKDEESARVVWSGLGLDVGGPVAVLHPGSGGSARDWSPQNFGKLATALTDDGFRVVVTGAANEESLVHLVVELSGRKAIPLVGKLSLKALAGFLRSADLFVSNSTGPLHIAAAVGTPVIGFYPPIRECGPRRWGPLTTKRVVFTADSAACPRCKGGPCQGNDCMDQITVEEVRRAAGSLVESQRKSIGQI
ncbi:MAG: glycosyltransferase family 9 protein [Ignavibacteria bacterium]|nr:glycosyltransferase family 9 protein [Ignavibacteria bacterium]